MEYVKILGAPSEDATTQTQELEIAGGGELFLLITLHSTQPALTRMDAIRGAVNFLHHELTKEEFEFEKFKRSVAQTLITPQFDAVCAYTKENVIYVFAVGNVSAALLRAGKLTTLVEGREDVQAVSGYLKETDTLVLSTKAFLSLTTSEELIPYLNAKKFPALETDVSSKIEQNPSHGECGIMCLLSKTTLEAAEDEFVPEEHEPLTEMEEELEKEEEMYTEQPEILPQSPVSEQSDFPREEVYVKSQNTYEARGKSKRLAYIGIVLLAILGVSIFFGNKARKAKQEAANVSKIVSDAQSALSEAKNISSVNKSRARDLIENARSQVLGVHTEATYPELLSMKDALTQSLGDVAGVYEVSSDVFSDLTLISQQTTADSLSISDNLVRVLSKSDKRIITIELPGKRTETLSGSSNLSSPTDITSYTKRTFVVASDGVYDVGSNASKQISLPTGQENMLISSFAGNLYVIDKSQNQIWRYSGDTVSFSDKKEWLSTDTTVDFSQVVGMGIDGNIWVYSKNGKLVKFTLGNAQTVPLKGLPGSLSENTHFFTDSDSDSLYLLDPSQKAVFVFDKTGELIATYTDVSLSQATHFIVSESNKIIVYSVGNKLYSIPLKHIR